MSKPEHIEQLESGGTVCRHCGGSVDAEGYAKGGDVESETEAAQEGDTAELPQQGSATPGLRELGFAEAVSRRAR